MDVLSIEKIMTADPTALGILTAFVIGIVTLVFLFMRSSTSKKRYVLITGLCDAGKTSITVKLATGKDIQTYSSATENQATFTSRTSNKSVRLVDIPGHEKVRYRKLEEFKSSSRGLVFVVDSSSVQKDIKDVAEYLFTLLTDGTLGSSRMPLLVACHKADVTMAKTARAVRAMLEKEITTLRVTRSAQLQGTDGGSSSNVFLGTEGQDFSFDQLKGKKITFCESSVTGEEPNLNDVAAWISKIA